MDPSTASHNADWMIPALITAMTVASAMVVGLIVWIVGKAIEVAKQFRADVLARLSMQDTEQAAMRQEQAGMREILGAIKDLLQEELLKVRERMWHHDTRISRLEQHNGLTPLRRHDEERGPD